MDPLFFHGQLIALTAELDDTITPERKDEIFYIEFRKLVKAVPNQASIQNFAQTNPEAASEILEHLMKLTVQLNLHQKQKPSMQLDLHTWYVVDVSGQKIGKLSKINNTFGVLQRLPVSNLVVPLTLWDGCDNNPNIWKQAAPLIQSLENLLHKRFVKRKGLITRQGIAETSVTIGDRGIELAINGTLNIVVLHRLRC